MKKPISTFEGYALNMETNKVFDPEKLYRGKIKVNCTAREARFCEAKKRGPYWYRFKNGNIEGMKPNLVAAELGLAILAIENHQSSSKK